MLPIPLFKPALGRGPTFDPYVYIYTYPEFSKWAFDTDGTSINVAAVNAIYAAFSTSHPYIDWTHSDFDRFNWKLYYMVKRADLILPNSSVVAYQIADPLYTLTFNGNVFTNTYGHVARYLYNHDMERLCKIHYARVSQPRG